MDLHIVPGVTAKEVAEAHVLDVKIQHHYRCKTMTYWIDEDKGSVFCLIEAPDKESVRTLHEKSHGLIPHEIIQVNTDVVRAFLGRIKDPHDTISLPVTNLTVFADPAFRIILVTRTMDARLLHHTLGKEQSQELSLLYSTVVREECRVHGGSEVYLREEGFINSFRSGQQAIECALAIQRKLGAIALKADLRIGVHAGDPVNVKDNSIFGATIGFAQFLCTIGKTCEITMSSVVRNLFKDNDWHQTVGKDNIRCLTAPEDYFLQALLDTLSSNWHNSDFDVPDFGRAMASSKAQLYRKCVALIGMSPNMLLREYRLRRSLELLRDEDRNISQTTFDAGFTSPSYFTKCFQKRFGIQPLAYTKDRF